MFKMLLKGMKVLYANLFAMIFLIVILGFPILSYNEEIRGPEYFADNLLQLEEIENYIYPLVNGCESYLINNAIGKPIVPIRIKSLLIPYDANDVTISFNILESDTIKLNGIPYPAQPFRPTTDIEIEFVNPIDSVYSSEDIYPSRKGRIQAISVKNAWKIARFEIYPIQYIPKDSLLIYNKNIEYILSYIRNGEIVEVPQFIINDSKRKIELLIDNYNMINPYTPVTTNLLNESEIDYVIIVPDMWKSYVKPLLNWKNKKGRKTKIVTLDEIYNLYPFSYDNPEKIRTAIIHMRNYWGAQWFLLVGQDDGDDEPWQPDYAENIGSFMPRRDLFPVEYHYHDTYFDEDTVAGDIYYSNLDGTWDADSDYVYGEVYEDAAEIDYYSDVFVGRVLAEDSTDVINYVNRIINYEKYYPIVEPNSLILAAGNDHYNFVNIIRNNYTIMDNFNVDLFNEGEGTYIKTDVINAMESGAGYICFLCHAWINKLIKGDDITTSITNNDLITMFSENISSTYNIFLSDGCWPGAYDYESFAENLLHCTGSGEGGAIAVLFNYRYGWFYYSDYLNADFLEFIGNYNSKKTLTLGEVFHYVKDNRTNHKGFGWNLYGDPELPLYNDGPFEFIVEHSVITGFGYPKTNITVKDKITGLPLDSAFVCCYITEPVDTGDWIHDYKTGYTDADGNFEYLHRPMNREGIIEITTTRQNYLPYEGECQISDRTVYVYYDNNIPVFENDSLIIEVLSFKKPDLPEINPAIENAKVVLNNRDNIYLEAYTDENGIAKFSSYISNLKNIQVSIFSDYNYYEPTANYNTYEGDMIPYMWSNIPDAAGKNNQRNLVKLPNSNICYMAYSDGDSIIVGKGTVSGMITDLQKVGKGINPVLSEIDNGIFVMWGDNPGLYYATIYSPISPVDTFIHFPPTINFSETVLEGNPDNDHIMGSVLEYRFIGAENADLIYAEFDKDLNVITMDTLIPYTGDEIYPEIVPTRSPIVSYYIRWGELYPITGFIDTMGIYRSKMVDYELLEWRIWGISETASKVNDISVNVYGNTTTFLWEKEIIADVVTEIWAKKMIEGVMQPSYKVSGDFGENFYYPICAHGNIYSSIDRRTAGDIIRIWTEDSLIWSYSTASHKYYPSIEIVNTLLGVYGMCVWTEQAGEEYEKPYIIRDKKFTVSQEEDPFDSPLFEAIPYDTQIVYESAIYDYVNGNPPVEQLSYTAPGLDADKYYTVEVITSENSPKKPQIISIDGDVFDIVFGKNNEENITIIELPLEYYEDRRITVSIDRLNGNSNRTADINIYEYEIIDETGTSAGGNKLVFHRDSDIFNIDYKEQIYSYNLYSNFNRHNNEIYFTLPENKDITISLYDITGRNIKCLHNGYVNRGKHTVQLPKNLSAGVYFIRLYGQGVDLQHKIVNIAK